MGVGGQLRRSCSASSATLAIWRSWCRGERGLDRRPSWMRNWRTSWLILWSVFTLADEYGVDLESSFAETMTSLTRFLDKSTAQD